MNWLITKIMGGTAGAASSEVRIALMGLISAAGLYYSGQPVQAVHLAMVTVGSYATSRGLAKLGGAIAEAMSQRDVAAVVAVREGATSAITTRSTVSTVATIAAEALRREAFAAADREVAEAEARRKAAYDAANAAFAAAQSVR